jgi:hypothetical protein
MSQQDNRVNSHLQTINILLPGSADAMFDDTVNRRIAFIGKAPGDPNG